MYRSQLVLAVKMKEKSVANELNKKELFVQFLISIICFQVPLYLIRLSAYYTVNHLIARKKLLIGKTTNLHPTVILRESHNIKIGNNCYFNHNTMIIGGHNMAKVIIGDYVQTGPNVCFFAANHNYENPEVPIKQQGYYEADITIGDDVWIGANSVITAGVSIGTGSIVGAGSVVTKDIPPYCVAVGSPARIIKYRKNID